MRLIKFLLEMGKIGIASFECESCGHKWRAKLRRQVFPKDIQTDNIACPKCKTKGEIEVID